MGLIEDYFKYQEEYEKKFGSEKTVVLLQVGSFYEIYEYDPEAANIELNNDEIDDNNGFEQLRELCKDNIYKKKIGKASELSSILNCILTKKNGKESHSLKNVFLIGFPIISYEKHRDVLLANDYTIIKIDQHKQVNVDKKGKKQETIQRKVDEIISVGTVIENINNLPINNYIIGIYIECQKHSIKCEDYVIICGISCIDITTGKNIVCEVYSKEKDTINAIQELYRFLISHQPKEIIIEINNILEENIEKYVNYIRETLELNNYPNVIIHINELNKEFLKISYHEQFLNKIFRGIKIIPNTDKLKIHHINDGTSLNIIEELNLERLYYGCVSYIILLQYCYEHNEKIINKIKKPDTKWIDEKKHLILTHNSIVQLNLLPMPKFSHHKSKYNSILKTFDSLFSVVNNASTTLGKRYLKNMLLNPITNIEKLEKFYNMNDEMMTITHNNKLLLDYIEQYLKKIPDIERLQRKLELQLIKPNEFVMLIKSYITIVDIYTLIISCNTRFLKDLLLKDHYIDEFNSFLDIILSLIDLDKLEKCKLIDGKLDFVDSFILEGKDNYADTLQKSIKFNEDNMYRICQHLNMYLQTTKGKLITFSGTRKTSKKISKDDSIDDDSSPSDDTTLTNYLITTTHKASVLKQNKSKLDISLCGNLEFKTIKNKTIITSDIIRKYCDDLDENKSLLEIYLLKRYTLLISELSSKFTFYNQIVKFISLLDFIKSNAKTAIKYKYFRPILDKSSPTSYLTIKDLRHPIIERIINNEYITNDITLNSTGILLYGCNSTGKSSLVKAIALNIILAQSGLFTSCQLTFSPFNRIITRLSGNDDLFGGKSSFVVEMCELRTILRHSDQNSLIIGDELCRGTENISGSSLTIATILTLVQRKSSFIFSTHMHNIVHLNYIKNIPDSQLQIFHLETIFDPSKQFLIYDRKLKPGSGSSIYGLEVAKSLDIDKSFISLANDIRRSITHSDQLLNTKTSRYNSNIFMDSCVLCGSTQHLNSHHLREQHEADDHNFIDYFHKNSSFNLIVLCHSCHDFIHSNKLSINKLQTTSGTILTIDDKH